MEPQLARLVADFLHEQGLASSWLDYSDELTDEEDE